MLKMNILGLISQHREYPQDMEVRLFRDETKDYEAFYDTNFRVVINFKDSNEPFLCIE